MKNKTKVFIRERLTTPFPTTYLPTIPLKLSAIFRYNEYKNKAKVVEREERKERDIVSSKYSTLVSYLDDIIDNEREELIASQPSDIREKYLLFRIHPQFECVLGRAVKYLSIQDKVELISRNENYAKIGVILPRLLLVKIDLNY